MLAISRGGTRVAVARGMRWRLLAVLALLSVAACGGRGCGEPLFDIDLAGDDTCTPAGGSCASIGCPEDKHADPTRSCGGFALPPTCCMPGRDPDGGSSGLFTPPSSAGTCAGTSCPSGCICRTHQAVDGCVAVCDCSTFPSKDPAPPSFCGNIRCAGDCWCDSQAYSECKCSTGGTCGDAGAHDGDAGDAGEGADADAGDATDDG